jgi:hypothetical protein
MLNEDRMSVINVMLISVSYSQICIFHENLLEPFNEWLEVNTKQGFSWRDQSVSFDTIIDLGKARLSVCLDETITNTCVRAISVPFSVPKSGIVIVSSIENGTAINIFPGDYDLIFEITKIDFNNEELDCKLIFNQRSKDHPEIIVKDDLLNPSYPLSTGSSPAK